MDHKTFMVLSILIATLLTGKCSQNQREKRGYVPSNSSVTNVTEASYQILSKKIAGVVTILNSCERERNMLKMIVGSGQTNSEAATLKLKDLINTCEQNRSKENVIAEQSLRKLNEQNKLLLDYMVGSEQGTPYPGVARYTKYIVARFGVSLLTRLQPLNPEFGPVINDILSFRYLINIPRCKEVAVGDDKRPSIFISVMSAAENFDRRKVIRNTWKNHLIPVRDKRGFHFIHFGFFLGIPNNMALQKLIENESNTYKDIIQIDMLDNHRNRTLKMAGVLNWIYGHCKLANFVFKVDDDVYVNIHNLAYFVELNQQELNVFGRVPRVESGRNENNYGPRRDGSHAITLDAWPWTTFPNYIEGSAYLIHGDLIVPLLAAFQTTPMIPFEDVYLTGIATEKAGIKKRFSLGLPSILSDYALTDVCEVHNHIAWINQLLPHNEVDNFYRGVSQCYTSNSFGISSQVDYANPLKFKFAV